MPGFLLHAGSTVLCAHGGQAKSPAPVPRVTVMGQPVVTQPVPYVVSGCPNVPGGLPTPCVAAQWVVAAARVKVMGQPVLLADSTAMCLPNGTPVNIVPAQTRVQGM